MDTITFQDFLLKLSLHTSIFKHTSNPNHKSIQHKMEQNLPLIAKKLWKALRVAYFMLRKNMSKPKLLADLGMAVKRVAGDRKAPADEYEFSCSNTPAFRLPFHLNKRKRSPEPSGAELFAAAMEIVEASPALPGFGRTPRVKQLRITDSPFPVVGEDDAHVDEAAEKFINKFYRDLKKQNTMGF